MMNDMYKENDNIDHEAIERYMAMDLEELEKLIKEHEEKIREQMKAEGKQE